MYVIERDCRSGQTVQRKMTPAEVEQRQAEIAEFEQWEAERAEAEQKRRAAMARVVTDERLRDVAEALGWK